MKLIVANWKMNPGTIMEARRLLAGVLKSPAAPHVEAVICPPFIYLRELVHDLSMAKSKMLFAMGAQNLFWESPPAGGRAYTGEISPAMLKEIGVEYSIIGHSERRYNLGETDEMVNKKVLAALKSRIKVVLCVGEPDRSLKSDEWGKYAKAYVRNQLAKNCASLAGRPALSSRLVVSYEPVWAISTEEGGAAADAKYVAEMIDDIKNFLITELSISHPFVLYGGSVDSKTIASFLRYDTIDGFLVGGASLKSKEFLSMIQIIEYDARHKTR
jgi:triosephosphate isomerase (TIM)